MYWFRGTSYMCLPWAAKTDEDYDNGCRRCEFKRTIENGAQHSILKMNLHYPKGNAHPARCLRIHLPGFELLKGDRLEPSEVVPDTGVGFDQMRSYPFVCTVWRRALETVSRHRNPLFDIVGIGMATIMVDLLHTVYLGLLHRFIWRTIQVIIRDNAYCIHGLAETIAELRPHDRPKANMFSLFIYLLNKNKTFVKQTIIMF